MQMYRVRFSRALAGDKVELGDVIVCAQDAALAGKSVAEILSLPSSGVEMDIHRVKPSLYQISRETVENKIGATEGRAVDAGLASRATFPGVTESMPDQNWYSVTAVADVLAEDDDQAIRRLAGAISTEMGGQKPKGVRGLELNASRTEAHARSPAIERNAIYTVHRIFAGGAARGK